MPKRRSAASEGDYTSNELRVLWYLKRHGPLVRQEVGQSTTGASLLNQLAEGTDLGVASIRHILGNLEGRSLVMRTYRKGYTPSFRTQGYNPLMKIELVDPEMYLPPFPKPVPPQFVLAAENVEMYERHVEEPSAEAIVDALLSRIEQLQGQVNTLQNMVEKLETRHQQENRPKPSHLTERLKNALTD